MSGGEIASLCNATDRQFPDTHPTELIFTGTGILSRINKGFTNMIAALVLPQHTADKERKNRKNSPGATGTSKQNLQADKV